MKSYTELLVWQEAKALVKEVYVFTYDLPESEKFGIISQLRRAAVSVPSNIAEGIGRNHSKDILQFLFIAKGSLNELETLSYLCTDLNLGVAEKIPPLIDKIISVRKLLIGFIKYKQENQ